MGSGTVADDSPGEEVDGAVAEVGDGVVVVAVAV